MRFVRFGIALERLQRTQLELVRQWRNSDWVRPNMRHRAIVLPADQESWFESLDPSRNWYFCAHVGDSPFALFHVKAIDWTQSCGESGGFVGDPAFVGRPETARATLALMDFAFLVLRLDSLEAQYSTSLPRIVRLNDQLGYRIFREESDGFVRGRVTVDRYLACAAPFRRAATALHGGAAILSPDSWLARRLAAHPFRSLQDFAVQLA